MTPAPALRASTARPQQVLTSLLGDFWYWRGECVPSVALVELLSEFGITPAGARTAMRRLAASGLLTVERSGRTTAYGVPPRSVTVIIEHTYRMMTFGASTSEWDGMWTVVTFSVPEKARGIRTALRARLRVMHFAALYDAVWVSPHDKTDEVIGMLDELGVSTASVLRSREVVHDSQQSHLHAAFDLSELTAEYRSFVEHYEPLQDDVDAGRIGPADALRIRTKLGGEWRRFREIDPDLPAELLPAEWPRERAHRVFRHIYDRLGPVAELRFRQVLARTAPELAELSSHHDSASVTSLHEALMDRARGDTPLERATEARLLQEARRRQL